MAKYILIHGIGDHQEGWSDAEFVADILEVPAEDVLEFYYEDLMEADRKNRWLKFLGKMAAKHYGGPLGAIAAGKVQDYINDLVVYFFSSKTRRAIQQRLEGFLELHASNGEDVVLLAHSLGSVVAYETLKNREWISNIKPKLVTLGSPLSKKLVVRMLDVDPVIPIGLIEWVNIFNRFDPIAGRVKLECDQNIGFTAKEPNPHDFDMYIQKVKENNAHIVN